MHPATTSISNTYTIISDGDSPTVVGRPVTFPDKASQGPATYTRWNRKPRFKHLPPYAWG